MGYEFFGEKIIFPSTPVLGINNDQSLKLFNLMEKNGFLCNCITIVPCCRLLLFPENVFLKSVGVVCRNLS